MYAITIVGQVQWFTRWCQDCQFFRRQCIGISQ